MFLLPKQTSPLAIHSVQVTFFFWKQKHVIDTLLIHSVQVTFVLEAKTYYWHVVINSFSPGDVFLEAKTCYWHVIDSFSPGDVCFGSKNILLTCYRFIQSRWCLVTRTEWIDNVSIICFCFTKQTSPGLNESITCQ
jgi:hypothetical protein